jgi:hypothetical protein
MKLNKFQGSESEELTLTPVVASLKKAKMVQAKVTKKKGSENCFLLAKDAKGNLFSWPCGKSVSLDSPLSELMFIEVEGQDVVCLPGTVGEMEDL